jgi:hypothetical protein
MCMYTHIDNNLSLFRRLVWGRLFGSSIEATRMAGGHSAEQTAHLAGMATSEWLAIEAGRVPETAAELRSMAGALECGYERMANLARLCGEAWK